jgi:hypothetical protein
MAARYPEHLYLPPKDFVFWHGATFLQSIDNFPLVTKKSYVFYVGLNKVFMLEQIWAEISIFNDTTTVTAYPDVWASFDPYYPNAIEYPDAGAIGIMLDYGVSISKGQYYKRDKVYDRAEIFDPGSYFRIYAEASRLNAASSAQLILTILGKTWPRAGKHGLDQDYSYPIQNHKTIAGAITI